MVADKYKDFMYNLIKKAVDEIGPRESCSREEEKLGEMMAEQWRPICDEVNVEPFKCHPHAFLGFFPLVVMMYTAALACYWLFPPLTFLIAGAAFAIVFFELLRYREFIDRFYPEAEGKNVVGVIKPKGEVKKRVIVGGHMDSAYEFNIWRYFRNGSIPIMIIGIAGVLALALIGLAKTVAMFNGSAGSQALQIAGIACICIYPCVSLLFFWHTYTPIPGAMDNMSAVSIATGVGQYLNDAKSNGSFFPQNTEVVLLATSSEEAGLRGAMRYASKHMKEMKETPTTGLFLDGVYDEKFLTVTTRELFAGAKHDPKLVKKTLEAAAKRGWPIRRRMIPLGASDAAAFSRTGISATCILCQDIDKLVPHYHTREDTPEKIRPESLAVCMQLVLDLIERIDGE